MRFFSRRQQVERKNVEQEKVKKDLLQALGPEIFYGEFAGSPELANTGLKIFVSKPAKRENVKGGERK